MLEIAAIALAVTTLVAVGVLGWVVREFLEVLPQLVRDLTSEAARERDTLLERIQRPERVPPRHNDAIAVEAKKIQREQEQLLTPDGAKNYATIGLVAPPATGTEG